MKRARFLFAAIAAMFERPQGAPAMIAPPTERAAQEEGLVSAASAARIRAAFQRFARVLSGGAG